MTKTRQKLKIWKKPCLSFYRSLTSRWTRWMKLKRDSLIWTKWAAPHSKVNNSEKLLTFRLRWPSTLSLNHNLKCHLRDKKRWTREPMYRKSELLWASLSRLFSLKIRGLAMCLPKRMIKKLKLCWLRRTGKSTSIWVSLSTQTMTKTKISTILSEATLWQNNHGTDRKKVQVNLSLTNLLLLSNNLIAKKPSNPKPLKTFLKIKNQKLQSLLSHQSLLKRRKDQRNSVSLHLTVTITSMTQTMTMRLINECC